MYARCATYPPKILCGTFSCSRYVRSQPSTVSPDASRISAPGCSCASCSRRSSAYSSAEGGASAALKSRDNPPAAAAPGPPAPIQLAAILQPRQRNAALRPILIAQPRHHREVARSDMQHRLVWPRAGCSIRIPTSSEVVPTRFTRARSTMSRVSSGTPRTRMESIAAVTTRAAG